MSCYSTDQCMLDSLQFENTCTYGIKHLNMCGSHGFISDVHMMRCYLVHYLFHYFWWLKWPFLSFYIFICAVLMLNIISSSSQQCWNFLDIHNNYYLYYMMKLAQLILLTQGTSGYSGLLGNLCMYICMYLSQFKMGRIFTWPSKLFNTVIHGFCDTLRKTII